MRKRYEELDKLIDVWSDKRTLQATREMIRLTRKGMSSANADNVHDDVEVLLQYAEAACDEVEGSGEQ